MSFSVLFAAYSHRLGLAYHLCHQVLALHLAAEPAGARVHVASTSSEQIAGLWDMLGAEIPANQLHELDNETTALTETAEQLVQASPPVVAHVQGTQQLKALIGIKQRHPDRLRIVYTVHSFRNATRQRLPYSWFLSRWLRRYVDYTQFLTPYALGEFANGERVLRGGRGGLMPLGLEPWPEDLGSHPPSERLPAELREFLGRVEKPQNEKPAGDTHPRDEPTAGRFIFLYLAKFTPGKGHDWLLRGLAPSLRRHAHAGLIFAGRGPDDLRASIRRLADEWGVARQLCMPGQIDRDLVPWVTAQCQVGLVASRSETFGHTVVEPMAAGLPVIGTRKGVAEWLIMDYHTGIGIAYGDEAAIGRAAEFMLCHPAEARAMGRNAAFLVKGLFTWDHVAACHLRAYRAALSPR